jgi:plasmid stabilization system protein ParE
MKVRYTARAFADRETIFDYLSARNPSVAREVKSFIKKQINDLQYFPERYPLIDEADVRARLVRYPYVVYYRIRGTEISILHIRHTSRRPWASSD